MIELEKLESQANASMVQQLSLVATVHKPEFNLVVNGLTALTGQKPRALLNENVVYRALVNLKYFQAQQAIHTSVNLSQIEQHLLKIRRTWQMYHDKNPNVIVNEILANDNEGFMKKLEAGEILLGELLEKGLAPIDYSLQISDIPAAGKRPVSSQTMYEINLRHTPDQLKSYLENLGYTEKLRFLVKGLRFLFNSTINIELFQVFRLEQGKLHILDPTENWFLKAYINVGKITDVTAISKASNDLVVFQKNLENLIKLKIPERNCMDSRISEKS